MNEGQGHIDARDSNIERLTQLNVERNEGTIGLEIPPGGLVEIKHVPATSAPPPKTNFITLGIVGNAGFVGRHADLRRLRDAMTAPPSAGASGKTALTQGFTGEGGIGKSQLAQRFAEMACAALGGGGEIEGEGWNLFDCAWWLDGSAAGHAKAVGELAAHLGHAPGKDDTAATHRCTVRERLSDGRRHLLIIDNLERTAPPAGPDAEGHDPWDVVRELTLPPRSRVLITTREQHLPVNLAACVELGVLTPADARTLLRQGRSDLADARHAAALDAVAEHLGRLALAIDLARAWLCINTGDSPASLLDRLKASDAATLEVFEDDELKGHAGGYRRSVAMTLALHMDPLKGSAAERILFAAAFAAPDRIPVTLLAAVTGVGVDEARDALRALAAKSILHRQGTGDGELVSLHRLTQTAGETMKQASQVGQWR